MCFIFSSVIIEGLIYLHFNNDFFYRFKTIALNYNYDSKDFFPKTATVVTGSSNFWHNLFYQVFVINLRSIFPRRFFLFVPVFALLQSVLNIRERKHLVLTYWFIATTILLLGFTTAFTSYKPLDLQKSWYLFPVFIPSAILASVLINDLKNFLK
jgi:hypothetical protein